MHARAVSLTSGVDALGMSANVWECYRQVFDDSGDDESWHSGMFARHVTRDGFRLVIARERGAVMGFSWG